MQSNAGRENRMGETLREQADLAEYICLMLVCIVTIYRVDATIGIDHRYNRFVFQKMHGSMLRQRQLRGQHHQYQELPDMLSESHKDKKHGSG